MPSKAVTVRFTEKEYERLDANARRLGVSRVSYIRFLVSLDFPTFVGDGDEEPGEDELEGTLLVPFINKGDVETIRVELARQGNNINQATKALNSLARLASENKAMRIDWVSYSSIAERNLAEVNESFKRCLALFQRLAGNAGFDCRNAKGKGM